MAGRGHCWREAGRKPGLFLFAALLASAPAAAVEPYFDFDAFAHAEPVPLEAFRDDWDAPLAPGGDALLHSRLETGVRWQGWALAYVARMDYEIKGSDAAAALYHRVRNRAPFAPAERFDLDLRIWHLESRGLKLSRVWRLDEALYLSAGLSLLEGSALTHGRLSGFATAVAARDYDFRARVDYRYSDDALFDREVLAPTGRGYTVDLGATGVLPGRIDWRLELRDVYGRMAWEAAPATDALATSDNKQFDADGYARYRPALSGFEGWQRFRQRIHPRALAEASWRFGERAALGLRLRASEVALYPGLLLQHREGDWRYEAEFLPRERALGLALGWKGLGLRWMADDLAPDEAHLLSAQVIVSHAF